ncbi:MAG: DUF2240 family protein [Methanosarcinaceae archaeon]|nr:DUF2240 family protein [Methanosarcinaceae archaeon]MDD4749298.1 DUF2240 family protein [Methanosarcinaceae archaeon]
MEELKRVVSAPFKRNLVSSLSGKDFELSLAFDFKWFSPRVASKVRENGLAAGLLKLEGDLLIPEFDLDSTRLPQAFRPSEEFERALEGWDAGFSKEKVVSGFFEGDLSFENLLNFIAGRAGLNKQTVVSEINILQERLSYLVDIRIVALLVAKKLGCGSEELYFRVSEAVFGTSALI